MSTVSFLRETGNWSVKSIILTVVTAAAVMMMAINHLAESGHN